MVGGLRSEWWARSDQNAGRLQIGIGGRLTSEFAAWGGPEVPAQGGPKLPEAVAAPNAVMVPKGSVKVRPRPIQVPVHHATWPLHPCEQQTQRQACLSQPALIQHGLGYARGGLGANLSGAELSRRAQNLTLARSGCGQRQAAPPANHADGRLRRDQSRRSGEVPRILAAGATLAERLPHLGGAVSKALLGGSSLTRGNLHRGGEVACYGSPLRFSGGDDDIVCPHGCGYRFHCRIGFYGDGVGLRPIRKNFASAFAAASSFNATSNCACRTRLS